MTMPPRDDECIVCGTRDVAMSGSADNLKTSCSRCGSFTLSGSALTNLPTKLGTDLLRRSMTSHALRRAQMSPGFDQTPIRDTDLESYWASGKLPDPVEVAQNLVLWLGQNQQFAHRYATPNREMLAAQIGLPIEPEGGDATTFGWLFAMFEARGWFRTAHGTASHLQVQLMPKGWEEYAALSEKKADSRKAFMAMKFGDSDLDWMVEHCFKPAVSLTGFTLKKLTDEQPAGLIDDQIRAALLSSRFVIADLSHANLGAYWEAGYAEGLGLPVIYTCERTVWDQKKTYFDTSHMLTVIWEKAKPTDAARFLKSTIRATLRSEAQQTD